MKSITVKIKNVYGQDKIYPICETAKNFARLANTSTITRKALEIIKQLNYNINVEGAKL